MKRERRQPNKRELGLVISRHPVVRKTVKIVKVVKVMKNEEGAGA
jgi:hypothetical protein